MISDRRARRARALAGAFLTSLVAARVDRELVQSEQLSARVGEWLDWVPWEWLPLAAWVLWLAVLGERLRHGGAPEYAERIRRSLIVEGALIVLVTTIGVLGLEGRWAIWIVSATIAGAALVNIVVGVALTPGIAVQGHPIGTLRQLVAVGALPRPLGLATRPLVAVLLGFAMGLGLTCGLATAAVHVADSLPVVESRSSNSAIPAPGLAPEPVTTTTASTPTTLAVPPPAPPEQGDVTLTG